MKTNFFENIQQLQLAGDLRIMIQNDTDGKMKVVMLLVNEKVEDSTGSSSVASFSHTDLFRSSLSQFAKNRCTLHH